MGGACGACQPPPRPSSLSTMPEPWPPVSPGGGTFGRSPTLSLPLHPPQPQSGLSKRTVAARVRARNASWGVSSRCVWQFASRLRHGREYAARSWCMVTLSCGDGIVRAYSAITYGAPVKPRASSWPKPAPSGAPLGAPDQHLQVPRYAGCPHSTAVRSAPPILTLGGDGVRTEADRRALRRAETAFYPALPF
jgi:hypothetical protein